MKNFLLFIFLFFVVNLSSQISTARDWTLTDCNNTTHTLYNYLDSNEVAVMMFHMGCSSCSKAGKVLENIKQLFDVSHPGKTNWFSMDYWAGHTCSGHEIPFLTNNNLSFHGFTGTLVKAEKDYYTTASPMPMIVVAGGTSHGVLWMKNNFFNTNNQDSLSVYNTINNFFNTLSVSSNSIDASSIQVFPNPAKNNTQVQFFASVKQNISIELYDVLGSKVAVLDDNVVERGNNIIDINLEKFSSGMYFLNIISENQQLKSLKLIKE